MSLTIPAYASDSHTVYGYFDSNTYEITYGSAVLIGIKHGEINTIRLHVVYDSSSNGLIEVFINDKTYSRSYRTIAYSASYASKAKLYSTNANVYFSNVIFSDTEISPKEQAIALPISATQTDMTAGTSGIFIADTAGQTLLQTPDVSALIEDYGASSQVTGIALVGNPAYTTGTGLAAMIGLSKSGGSTAEHDSCPLSGDSTATIMDGWGLSNATIADLADMQFGWKAGV